MEPGLRRRVEERLWPLVEQFTRTHPVAGLAVAVVQGDDVVARGFGVRDVGTSAPVTPTTMFHLASVSKPFVATAVVSLGLDLDAPVTAWLPEFTLADGRAGEVTVRQLLSHTSGLPDVTDYGWHEPQLGDDALEAFARSLAGWRLQTDPGTTYSYSNAGYELLGLLLARATGTTFEEAVRRLVLTPYGMRRSTFLRGEVPADLAASPHVGWPLQVPPAYPYSRRHAPSSTLHANLEELCGWMRAVLARPDRAEPMWWPVRPVGTPPWEEAVGLGWAIGSHRGHRMVSHSGLDPGFVARLALLPDRRRGVVVLANSNTVAASVIALAGLDVALDLEELDDLRGLAATVVGPGVAHLSDDDFEDAVWGAIELRCTNLVWPLLRRWTRLRPGCSLAWTMTGWAHQVDGAPDLARGAFHRALELDPANDDAARLLRTL